MFARHSLVWLTDAGWQAAALSAATEAEYTVIGQWRAHDWPAIVRRTEPGTPHGQHCLGIAAPPCQQSGRKVRVALRIAGAQIARVADSLPLSAAIDHAPAPWRADLAALAHAASASGLPLQVYGSLAMQAITGQAYLTAGSDIDLLAALRDDDSLRLTLDLLTHYATPLPLDGELLFPSGHAVSWKEWVRARQDARGIRVLAKHADAVCLMDMDALKKTLSPAQGQTREPAHA